LGYFVLPKCRCAAVSPRGEAAMYQSRLVTLELP
jgi:hypothetical protein